jgi:hypothetical protein
MPLPDDETKDVAIHDNASTSTTPLPVTTTVAGAKRRLDVDAQITGEVSLSQSTPRWDYSAATVGLTNGVDYTVLTQTAAGFVDFIQVVCKNSSYDIVIEIDGAEELRISMSDLGTIGLLSSNSTNIPIYAASASKICAIYPNEPFHFSTDFTIKVQATAGGNNIDGWMVSWREVV